MRGTQAVEHCRLRVVKIRADGEQFSGE
jgi:hypothetical protein